MKKILIAEDRPETRELLRVTFSVEEEALVLEAFDGEEALHIALQERPDLVLLDLMMPGLGGLEVCRRLKSDARTKGTIVLILTARSQSADRELARQGGADGYIVKPFSPADLLQRVRKALG